jgi:hypothetical protein
MCLVKTAKPVAPTAGLEKEVQVLRNPFLDGLDPLVQAKRTGMSSLRVDRARAGTPTLPGRIVRPVVGGPGPSPSTPSPGYTPSPSTGGRTLPALSGNGYGRITRTPQAQVN